MSDELTDTAHRLFKASLTREVRQSAEQGMFSQTLWDALTEAGFTAALLPETAGGFGLSVAEAMSVLNVSAAYAAPVPLAETMLAGWLLARAGLPIPQGALTLAPVRLADHFKVVREGSGWHLSGTASRIPWARNAVGIAVLADAAEGPCVALLTQAGFNVSHDANLAGEPRDRIVVDAMLPDDAVSASPIDKAGLRAAGACLRTVQIAGALSRALDISVEYAKTRVQFGRPIAKFQAIQHNLAILAGQSAAALAAADMATDALAEGLSPLLVGAAKARAGEAASVAAGLAHQSHGAIGFTQEYQLHPYTRRLWSWRDEFGNEAEWNAVVGRLALAAGADGLWPALTAA